MLEICLRCGKELNVDVVADQDGTLCRECFDKKIEKSRIGLKNH